MGAIKSLLPFFSLACLLCVSLAQDVDWANLTTEELAELTPGNFTSITAAQLGSIPPDACNGFQPAQIPSIPNIAITGFTALQVAQLPTNVCAVFSQQQINSFSASAAGGIQPTCMAGFQTLNGWNTNLLLALSNGTISSISAQQLSTIASWTWVTVAWISNVNPPSCAGIGSANSQVSWVIPQNAIVGITAQCVSYLNASTVWALTFQQLQQFSPASAYGFTQTQISNIQNANQGWTVAQLQNLNPDACAGFGTNLQYCSSTMSGFQGNCTTNFQTLNTLSTTQVSYFSQSGIQGLTAALISSLTPNGVAGFSSSQTPYLNPAACAAFTSNQFSQISYAAISGLSPACVQNLAPSVFTALSTTGVTSLNATAFTVISVDQFNNIPTTSWNGFSSAQTAQFNNALCTALNYTQFSSFPAVSVAGFTPSCFASMPTNILINALTTQIAQINLVSFGSLSQDKILTALSSVLAGITITQASLLNGTICSNITSSLFSIIPTAAIPGFTPDCVSIWPDDIFVSGTPAKLSAMSGVQVAAITVRQIITLPNKFITYFTVNQLAFLSPSCILALNSAKIVYLIQTYSDTFPSLYNVQNWAGESIYTIEAVKLQITTPPYIQPSISYLDLQWETATWLQIALLLSSPIPPFDRVFFESIPPQTLSGIRYDQVSLIPPTSFKWLPAATANFLAADTASEMSVYQFVEIPPSSFSNITFRALYTINSTIWSSLLPAQIGALNETFWDYAPCWIVNSTTDAQKNALQKQSKNSMSKVADSCGGPKESTPTTYKSWALGLGITLIIVLIVAVILGVLVVRSYKNNQYEDISS